MPDIDDVGVWYHTIEMPDGRVTPGWFDLRPVLDDIPWPDVKGKRCLDVGTWDGHLAFELERRGASEVIATDIPSHEDWDWLPRERGTGPGYHDATVGQKGLGFEVARDLLGSGVTREWINIYDLSPERLGEFDVVVCGALLLHLREPFRALESLRSVTRSTLLSIEQVDELTSIALPRWPVMHIDGRNGRWAIPNIAGHQRMLEVAGFRVRQTARLSEPFGVDHPAKPRQVSVARRARRLVQRRWFGHHGIPSSAVLADVEMRPPPLAREVRAGAES